MAATTQLTRPRLTSVATSYPPVRLAIPLHLTEGRGLDDRERCGPAGSAHGLEGQFVLPPLSDERKVGRLVRGNLAMPAYRHPAARGPRPVSRPAQLVLVDVVPHVL